MERAAEATEELTSRPRRVLRHRLSTRLWHWSNALAVFVLLMSGLMIFNAHPRLYWGQYGANTDRAWLQIGSDETHGYLRVGDRRWDTTGVLGRWSDANGATQRRAFPHWATLPSTYNLALARRWHLSFAWLFALGLLGFMIRAFSNGHVARDLSLTREELKPGAIWGDVRDHLRLRFDHGERYNLLQKASYILVVFALLPLLIFTGLAMSPGMNAAWPWLIDIFGGRQSARSIHFIIAALIAGFIGVHLLLVLLSGPIRGVGGMITGRETYR
ncbi:cytochrome b/b6 domain-containing protein [Sphingomonas sp. LaA6.9]|uniref:cytochrome b/b6 domain-containing protein n=1 Tax=Sphingomonas sp. LaA6.9 TaxID=2919914 RepID=UPI001F4FFC8D|nr:cytochrome b/b6 domain-containing protein [Sphingomonas sp. LaA6.9]MCJ8158768.1 cytochrome b/b6 domain-containing protein [Sphingomonas sp. LaA6.9]